MYCAGCGTQLVPGLSYCNRCGFDVRERRESNTTALSIFLAAITLVGLCGLGIMIGGAIALSKNSHLPSDLIAVFMLLTFLVISGTELMLFRNLSKLTGQRESKERSLPSPATHDLRLPHASSLGEPVPSVTENTTRTLEYAGREQERG